MLIQIHGSANQKRHIIFHGKIKDIFQCVYLQVIRVLIVRVEDALEKAIDTCINQDVLAEFLKKHRAEVTNMILTTYDKDLYEKTLKEDAREEGRAEIRA